MVEPNPVADFVGEVLSVVKDGVTAVDEEVVAHDDTVVLPRRVCEVPGEEGNVSSGESDFGEAERCSLSKEMGGLG